MLRIPDIIFLSIFIFFSVANLVFCVLEMSKLRKITKCFCVGFLLAFIIHLYPTFNFVWLALILAIIGDFFMMFIEKYHLFALGGFSFFFCHIFYAITIIISINATSWWQILIICLSFVMSLLLSLLFLKKVPFFPKKFAPLALMYFATLAFMFGLSITYLILVPNKMYGILVLVGYILFIISDIILFYCAFGKKLPKKDFIIMLPYLVAQFLIAFSLVSVIML